MKSCTESEQPDSTKHNSDSSHGCSTPTMLVHHRSAVICQCLVSPLGATCCIVPYCQCGVPEALLTVRSFFRISPIVQLSQIVESHLQAVTLNQA